MPRDPVRGDEFADNSDGGDGDGASIRRRAFDLETDSEMDPRVGDGFPTRPRIADSVRTLDSVRDSRFRDGLAIPARAPDSATTGYTDKGAQNTR